jgi:hypothetical protein
MSNPKNILQQYCQKHKLPVPIYKTKSKGHQHKLLWKARVILFDGSAINGSYTSTKVHAEMIAAENALKYIVKSNKPNKPNNGYREVQKRTCLLVDVENLPSFIDDVVSNIRGLDIYGFVGKHHCLVDKDLPNNAIKIVSPSTRKDGTDSCMQMYVGYLLTLNKYDTYYIATRDHFGGALVDVILGSNEILGLDIKNIKAFEVTKVEHIV